MVKQLNVPDFAVVVVLANRLKPGQEILSRLSGFHHINARPDQPDFIKSELKECLDRGKSASFLFKNSNPIIRQTIAKIARSEGAGLVVIRLDDAEPDALNEKHERIYSISSDQFDFEITRTRMPSDKRYIRGEFDLIGDVHGCADELLDLLRLLGHAQPRNGHVELISHRDGRKVVLLGDLTDRGPKNLEALHIARQMAAGYGHLVTLGNHDHKLARWLRGNNVQISSGLRNTVDDFTHVPQSKRIAYADWLDTLQSHYVLNGGNLVAAHAGMKQHLHGRSSSAATSFGLYGEPTKELDKNGIPVLRDWARSYEGSATVVHGHVVTSEPRILNNVISIDTGCVFGGKLTAYRYPEGQFVSVDARATYCNEAGSRKLI